MDLTPQQTKAIYFLILILLASLGYQVIKQNYLDPKYDFSGFDSTFYHKRDSLLKIKNTEEEKSYSDLNVKTKHAPPSSQGQRTLKPININTASIKALTTLPRIGPRTAAKIVQFRSANGGFKEKEDIMKVKGIGQKTFELIKDQITVK